MNKSELDFLKEELAQLKARLAALEERISAIKEEVDEAPAPAAEAPAADDEVDFTGVEIGVAAPAVPEAPEAPETPAEPEAPVAPAEPEAITEPEAPAAEPAAVEPVAIEEPAVSEEKPAPAPVDTSNMPWRKDKPGLSVKNIRSGISLLDRAQFIGTLFKEDFALYDNTIADLNNMSGLDEAVAYIQEHFPQWDLRSEVAYRFMMAIRKKLG